MNTNNPREGGAADSDSAHEPSRANENEFRTIRDEFERAREGEPEAREAVWTRYHRAFLSLVYKKLKNINNPVVKKQLEAEDVLNDVACIFLEELQKFEYRGPEALYGWMDQVVTRRIQYWIDYLEAGKRNRHREVAISMDTTSTNVAGIMPKDPRPGPVTQLKLREREERIARAVAGVEEPVRTMIILKIFMKAKWDDVAKATNAKSGETARKAVTAALDAMKDELEGI